MSKITGPSLFIIPVFIMLSGCASRKGFDENGDPVFNSILVKDTTLGRMEVAVHYYTVANNIANRNSSVFVSEKPTEDQIWDFVVGKPSYFFIVHKSKFVSKMAILMPESEREGAFWYYDVVDENKNRKRMESNLKGSLTHHRFLEMAGKLDESDYKESEINNGIGVPNHKKVFYKVASLNRVLEDFEKMILETESD